MITRKQLPRINLAPYLRGIVTSPANVIRIDTNTAAGLNGVLYVSISQINDNGDISSGMAEFVLTPSINSYIIPCTAGLLLRLSIQAAWTGVGASGREYTRVQAFLMDSAIVTSPRATLIDAYASALKPRVTMGDRMLDPGGYKNPVQYLFDAGGVSESFSWVAPAAVTILSISYTFQANGGALVRIPTVEHNDSGAPTVLQLFSCSAALGVAVGSTCVCYFNDYKYLQREGTTIFVPMMLGRVNALDTILLAPTNLAATDLISNITIRYMETR